VCAGLPQPPHSWTALARRLPTTWPCWRPSWRSSRSCPLPCWPSLVASTAAGWAAADCCGQPATVCLSPDRGRKGGSIAMARAPAVPLLGSSVSSGAAARAWLLGGLLHFAYRPGSRAAGAPLPGLPRGLPRGTALLRGRWQRRPVSSAHASAQAYLVPAGAPGNACPHALLLLISARLAASLCSSRRAEQAVAVHATYNCGRSCAVEPAAGCALNGCALGMPPF
jgi:hypothetical protein